jgi:hypothetical protein
VSEQTTLSFSEQRCLDLTSTMEVMDGRLLCSSVVVTPGMLTTKTATMKENTRKKMCKTLSVMVAGSAIVRHPSADSVLLLSMSSHVHLSLSLSLSPLAPPTPPPTKDHDFIPSFRLPCCCVFFVVVSDDVHCSYCRPRREKWKQGDDCCRGHHHRKWGRGYKIQKRVL